MWKQDYNDRLMPGKVFYLANAQFAVHEGMPYGAFHGCAGWRARLTRRGCP